VGKKGATCLFVFPNVLVNALMTHDMSGVFFFQPTTDLFRISLVESELFFKEGNGFRGHLQQMGLGFSLSFLGLALCLFGSVSPQTLISLEFALDGTSVTLDDAGHLCRRIPPCIQGVNLASLFVGQVLGHEVFSQSCGN
jgi:hypothetical protein